MANPKRILNPATSVAVRREMGKTVSICLESDPALATLPVDSSLTLADVRRKAIDDIERNYLKELLARNKGNSC